MSSFQPLEVVGRGSDPQLQVGENLNDLFLIREKYANTSNHGVFGITGQ